MSKMQRDKGARVEREIVQRFKDIGLWAEKVPLSGAAGGSFSGDILVEDYTVEVKARKDGTGFRLLYRWLGDNDILVCKQDRTEPLVVMTIQTLGDLLSEHGPPPSPRIEDHFDKINTKEEEEEKRLIESVSANWTVGELRAIKEINERTARRILKEENEGGEKS